MTSDVDICNMALGEIGARFIISSIDESTPAAAQCRVFYNTLRQQVLRTAPWSFARKTLSLTPLGLASDDPTTWNQYPWLAKYLYPPDCLKLRYVLPPPWVSGQGAPNVSSGPIVPWCPPSREWRFIVAVDDTDPDIPMRKVLVSNVVEAIGVYTANIIDPDLFDQLFTNALSMALGSKLVMPLTGNVALKADFIKLAQEAITQARVADGNEAIPTSDHVPDWMQARGVPSSGLYGYGGVDYGSIGSWFGGWDDMAWGM